MKAVLFVDDNEVLARLSCEILQMEGFHAVAAYNAQEALRAFDAENFDILVTDFRMEGMNGLELARAIHEKHPKTPIIIVTAYGPIQAEGEVKACLAKEGLFPGLLDQIRFFLAEDQEERTESVQSTQ